MDNAARPNRATQRTQLLELLKAHSPDWVPIRDVVAIAGFQYGARILELRRLGHRIQNDPGRAFRLVVSPLEAGPSLGVSVDAASEPRLFPDDAPLRHLDLG